MRSGVCAVCQDYQNDPRARPYRERAIATGVRSMVAFPIKRGGKVVGTLALYEAELAYFNDALLGLMDELVAEVSFALENIDLESAATAARQETLASHEQFRRLFKAAPAAYVITTLADLRIVEVNDVACELYAVRSVRRADDRQALAHRPRRRPERRRRRAGPRRPTNRGVGSATWRFACARRPAFFAPR